jgi:putative NADH-flavin reductase
MFSMTHKICIFGASGATGLALTQLAREDGHCVVAFVRSQPAKEKLPPGVTVVVGNLLTSGLDWTLIKPPRLTGGPARGRVRSGENLSIGALSSISRLDLSRFILDGMETPGYIGKRVVVRY